MSASGCGRLGVPRRQDHADQAVIQLVLHSDEGRGDLHQRPLIGAQRTGHDLAQPLGLRLHARAQLTETEHTERVADLAQQLHLRGELLRLAGTAAHEDIEHVLDLAEILADRGGDRLHELHGGRREILTLLLDAFIDRQQLRQAERAAHRAHAPAGGLGAADVVEEIVEQLHRRACA